MIGWKTQLADILNGLARTHAAEPLSQIQRILCGVLQLEEITFQDRSGRELRPELSLQQALDQIGQVLVRLPWRAGTTVGRLEPKARSPESRFRQGPPPNGNSLDAESRYDAFVREFLRLQERHEFMWAGYVVRELLPRLGFAADEAKVVLDHLRAENVVTITKVPNAKNPDFPATSVQLNRDHPRVRAILAEKGIQERLSAAGASANARQPASLSGGSDPERSED